MHALETVKIRTLRTRVWVWVWVWDGAKHKARCRVRPWFIVGCMVTATMIIVRLHGAG